VKLKHLVAAFAALGFTAVGSAADAAPAQSVDAQLNYLQAKVAKLEDQANKSTMSSSASSKSMTGSVTFDRELSKNMLSFNSGSGTEMFLLNARHNGMAANSLYLGGLLRGVVSYSNVTTAVNAYDAQGPVVAEIAKSASSSVALPQAELLFIGNINDFTTGVVELEGSTGTAEIAQAYLLLGNLDESMFFGTIGSKVPTFGDFSTYNTSYQPLTRTYFQPGVTNQVSVGATRDGFTFVASAMNGGSSVNNLYTKTATKINNAAFDLKYTYAMYGTDWTLGAGYLRGFTGSATTVTQSTGTVAAGDVVPGYRTITGNVVGAYDYNASVSFDSFKLQAEYVTAAQKVNTTSLYAYNLGALYAFQWMGKDTDVHAGYGALTQQTGTGTRTATNSQVVLGLTHHCAENFQMGLEYALNRYQIGLASSQTFSSNGLALSLQANF